MTGVKSILVALAIGLLAEWEGTAIEAFQDGVVASHTSHVATMSDVLISPRHLLRDKRKKSGKGSKKGKGKKGCKKRDCKEGQKCENGECIEHGGDNGGGGISDGGISDGGISDGGISDGGISDGGGCGVDLTQDGACCTDGDCGSGQTCDPGTNSCVRTCHDICARCLGGTPHWRHEGCLTECSRDPIKIARRWANCCVDEECDGGKICTQRGNDDQWGCFAVPQDYTG